MGPLKHFVLIKSFYLKYFDFDFPHKSIVATTQKNGSELIFFLDLPIQYHGNFHMFLHFVFLFFSYCLYTV